MDVMELPFSLQLLLVPIPLMTPIPVALFSAACARRLTLHMVLTLFPLAFLLDLAPLPSFLATPFRWSFRLFLLHTLSPLPLSNFLRLIYQAAYLLPKLISWMDLTFKEQSWSTPVRIRPNCCWTAASLAVVSICLYKFLSLALGDIVHCINESFFVCVLFSGWKLSHRQHRILRASPLREGSSTPTIDPRRFLSVIPLLSQLFG